MSRDELNEHFRKMAEEKTTGQHDSATTPPEQTVDTNFNGWDQVAKGLFSKKNKVGWFRG